MACKLEIIISKKNAFLHDAEKSFDCYFIFEKLMRNIQDKTKDLLYLLFDFEIYRLVRRVN